MSTPLDAVENGNGSNVIATPAVKASVVTPSVPTIEPRLPDAAPVSKKAPKTSRKSSKSPVRVDIFAGADRQKTKSASTYLPERPQKIPEPPAGPDRGEDGRVLFRWRCPAGLLRSTSTESTRARSIFNGSLHRGQ